MKIDIKKGNGIDGLVEGHSSQKLEEIKEIKPEAVHKFRILLNMFEEALKWGGSPAAVGGMDLSKRIYIGSEFESDLILNPIELNAFMQIARDYNDGENAFRSSTGLFFDRLIQQSFNNGHNDFEFYAKDFGDTMDFISHLEGKEDSMLNIIVNGTPHNTGYQHMKFVDLTVNGKAWRTFGMVCDNCNFMITDEFFMPHHSSQSTNCIYKTTRKENIDILVRYMNPYYNGTSAYDGPSQNKVIFVDKDGTERVIKEYAD